MGDYNSNRTNHDFMSLTIYNFLDNLLAAVRPSETLESEAHNRDQITTQVIPGGYSEDIFIFLSDREKEEYNCSICYSVVKDAYQCRNSHKFCYSCIFVWSTCNRSGADCCPVGRCDGVYAKNEQLNEKIGRKRVKCFDEGCNWRGFLRDYSDHEHRTYDFRELNSSIDLPILKDKESLNVGNFIDLKKSEVTEVLKSENEISSPPVSHDININNIGPRVDEETSTTSGSSTVRVTRTGLAPRRLSRGNENSLISSRTSMLRPNLSNNYPRSTPLATRCPTYRNSINTTRLSRLPRNNLSLTTNSDSNYILNENTHRQISQSEYTQTNILDSNEVSFESTTSVNNESSRVENLESIHRGVSGNIRRGTLLPAINTSNVNHVSSDREPMEYRRLAPTYASRRNNFVGPNEGREQLAMMLILLTSDLEDRVTLNEQSRDQINNHVQSGESTSSVNDNNSSSSTNRSSVRLGRSRLQEFRNLNRRLSEVANSLDRLIASTTRDGDYRYTPFNGTPESSTSNTASDADEEFNNNSSNR